MMVMTKSKADEIEESTVISPNDLREKNVNPSFRYVVDMGFEEANGKLIENHSMIDAWYLFRKILAFAKKKKLPVTLVCGTMLEDFYNCLTSELKDLIDAKIAVHAYLTKKSPEEIDPEKNRFAALLREAAHRNPEDYALIGKRLENSEEIPHVVYAGEKGQAFRWETNQKMHEAVAGFGPMDKPLGRIAVSEIKKYIPEIGCAPRDHQR